MHKEKKQRRVGEELLSYECTSHVQMNIRTVTVSYALVACFMLQYIGIEYKQTELIA